MENAIDPMSVFNTFTLRFFLALKKIPDVPPKNMPAKTFSEGFLKKSRTAARFIIIGGIVSQSPR